MGISAHYEVVGLVLFSILAALPAVPLLRNLTSCVRGRKPSLKGLPAPFLFAAAVYSAVSVDAFLVEPNWPELETVRLKAHLKKPLRILLLSDLHLESEPSRREKFLHGLRDLKPDLVFLTGDVLQLDVKEAPRLKSLLAELQPSLGHYACLGVDNEKTISAAGVNILANRGVLIDREGEKIGICGLLPITGRNKAYESISGASVRIALNHTPDLADEAAEQGADLYLCGHTHGGQVRIPFWGAIITNSNSGKKYEAGLYKCGRTHIYTSRGFGLEPRPAPQVRFFCRPQATLFVLSGG